MAEIKLANRQAECNQVVDYMTEDGCHVDLENLRLNLISISQSVDSVACRVRKLGHKLLAVDLESIYFSIRYLAPMKEGNHE